MEEEEMNKRIISLALSILLVMSVLLGCSANATTAKPAATSAGQTTVTGKSTVITMTFAPAENSPHHKAGLEFARLVKEKTNGAYTVEVYPNSQLAGGNQLGAIEMVQKGSITCGWLSPLVMAGIESNLNATSIPWLWKDVATIDKTMKSGSTVDKELNRIINAKGYEFIGYGENGFREISNSKVEIKSPANMKGIKFRVLGKIGRASCRVRV